MKKPTKKLIREIFKDITDNEKYIIQPISVIEIKIQKLFKLLKDNN